MLGDERRAHKRDGSVLGLVDRVNGKKRRAQPMRLRDVLWRVDVTDACRIGHTMEVEAQRKRRHQTRAGREGEQQQEQTHFGCGSFFRCGLFYG